MITSDPPLVCPASLGHRLDIRPEKFGSLETANDLLGDPVAQRERLERDGYLYFKRFLDTDRVLAARRALVGQLAEGGQLDPAFDSNEGVPHWDPSRRRNFQLALGGRTPEVLDVVFSDELESFYGGLFGEPVRHLDFVWTRIMGPGHGTAAHCDWVYMGRGTPRLLTCWIPYGEIPLEVGGLILLENSHRQSERIKSYLDVDVDAYCENRPRDVLKVAEQGGWSHPGWLSKFPASLPDKFQSRWLTSPCWEPGDFITFTMTMIHGSLDNQSARVRISTDTRWQPASEPADERWIGPNPVGHGRAGKRGRIC